MKRNALIKSIHHTPQRVVLVIAGAGTTALASLLEVAGASNTLLEALVPYQHNAFVDFLGSTPRQYVAADTARSLAGVAFQRAIDLEEGATSPIGVACTATITTTRKKRGEHRAHIAFWSMTRVVQYELQLAKGKRSRKKEEESVAILLLNVLAEAMQLEERLPLPLSKEDRLERTETDFEMLVKQLTENKITHFGLTRDGRQTSQTPGAILSGSFNPLHQGHTGLAEAAANTLAKGPVAFECTAVNADKPPLTPTLILKRMAQFAGRWPIFVSNAPTFVQKSRLYPGASFIVGYDTAVRVLNPVYYDKSIEKRNAALTEIGRNGCDFLVAGRVDQTGKFNNLSDIRIPAEYHHLFHSINEADFRRDISSTEIRQQLSNNSRTH